MKNIRNNTIIVLTRQFGNRVSHARHVIYCIQYSYVFQVVELSENVLKIMKIINFFIFTRNVLGLWTYL